jgi:hypothetical protein
MKTNYNQVNNFRVVARNTAFLLVMIFPLPVMAAPEISPV